MRLSVIIFYLFIPAAASAQVIVRGSAVQPAAAIEAAAPQAVAPDSAQWQTAYLNMNSGYDDFCPAVFNRGLLFVSNRGRTRVAQYRDSKDQSPFFTIYYVYDVAMLKGTPDPQWKTAAPVQPKAIPASSNDTRKVAATKPAAPLPENVVILKGDQHISLFNQQVNGRFNDGPVSFNQRQDTMYITRNGRSGNKKSPDRLQIHTFIYRYGDWLPAGIFPFNSNEYSTGHPAVHPNGHLLYFVSDRPGGVGGTDIYYTQKIDSGWSEPQNAGQVVNTPGNEMFPYFAPDGTLYFSSDGRGGEGGLDLFFVQLSGNTPTGEARNLGAPVNSPQDDFGIWLNADGRSGYFSSNRYGTDDVFEMKRK
ncbi:TolB family protein [Chitinophaga barathri]|uniref:Uncharacterized protein n=1 Tax=Chitinophaga barathri TaxID=1647451 RepID=A0A3N4M9B7_9BACT|nr:PD40 domain-containing protein [Chitinophaga barathri]RPD37897.1 hypothetical protein EG028_27845 [Chitinophaga barathri]